MKGQSVLWQLLVASLVLFSNTGMTRAEVEPVTAPVSGPSIGADLTAFPTPAKALASLPIPLPREPNIGMDTAQSTRIDDDPNSRPKYEPQLAYSSGTLYAVWADTRGVTNTYNIYFSKSTDSGRDWSANQKVTSGQSPVITIGPQGQIYIAFIGLYPSVIYFIRSSDGGGTWGTPTLISDATGYLGQSYPAIAVDNNGSIFVAWADGRNGYSPGCCITSSDIYWATSVDQGLSFSANFRLPTPLTWEWMPAIRAVNGTLYFVWQGYRVGYSRDYDVYFTKTSNNGAIFSPIVMVNEDNGARHVAPALFVVGDAIYVSWDDSRNSGLDQRVYFAKSTDGGMSFGTNLLVSTDNSANDVSYSSIAVDRGGVVYVAWEARYTSPGNNVYLSALPTGGASFYTVCQLNDNTQTGWASHPSLVLDSEGTVHVVWLQQMYVSPVVDYQYGIYERAVAFSFYSITGRVADNGNNPMSGVTVTAKSGTSTLTDASGYYTFTGLISGTYTLTPTKSGYAFSPASRTVTVPPNAVARDFKGIPVPSGGVHLIDLSISVYRPVTGTERAAYKNILGYFADAVFEMSSGTHKIRNVTIYYDSGITRLIDNTWVNVVWNASEWPRSDVAGYGHWGEHVWFGDNFPFPTPYDALAPNNQQGAGYALAHEWGHYYYGLYDEYRGDNKQYNSDPTMPHTTDTPVPMSIMDSEWNAVGGNYSWLNFSAALNAQDGKGETAQDRIYHASDWETIARPTSQDPPRGFLSTLPQRTYYPELTAVAPITGQLPPIELPSTPTTTTRSDLRIVWPASTSMSLVPKAVKATADYVAVIEPFPSADISYPESVLLSAHVAGDHLIARASVTATVTSPDGSVSEVVLKDDGAPPDAQADDGLYSGLMGYTQNGNYLVTVQFDNHAGSAVFTDLGTAPSIGPNGETFSPTLQPVTEDFTATATTHVLVSNYQADDHDNTIQTATAIPADNVATPGRIDYAGDVDVFKVVLSGTGKLIVRVTDLALGMLPRIRLLRADGTTVMGSFDYQPQAGVYFSTVVDSGGDGYFYVEISHQDSAASTGLYSVSAGPPVAGENHLINGLYLPFVLK